MSSKFKTIITYIGIALLLGFLAGIVTSLFGRILLWIGEIRSIVFYFVLPALALAGLSIVFSYQKWGAEVRSGMGLVFEVAQGQDKRIPFVLLPLIAMTTWVSHLFGASVGREGVAVQLGAVIAQTLEKWAGTTILRSLLIKMGMAAGFAGLFQTPLAASLFAIEVLYVGHYAWRELPPILLAALTASLTSHWLGLEKFQYSLSVTDHLGFLPLIVLGLSFGCIGNLFALGLSIAKKQAEKWLKNPYLRMTIMGISLSVLLFFHQGRYSGLGTNLIEASLTGEVIYPYDWLLKLLLTILCLTAGFQGGEVTPLFAIGASSGAILAGAIGLPTELVVALGYCAVFGAATNTLLTPYLIGYEVFGTAILPYAVPVLVISYFINRKQTIYGQQLR
ncbi:TPA: chloride channel protein [Streptococcus suis]